ncbi:hypothetical protein [Streptomyces orinoci]|uniref:Uncharacterized protein n=1 Tax=Streptomyces orinoci TaxID=67339 RepID=A0ABV3K099_STRON|nr:hypothetical protein [Streptomyces orinoci]
MKLRPQRLALTTLSLAAVVTCALVTSTTAQAAPAAPKIRCGGQAYAPPGTGWGPESLGNCAVYGSAGSRKGFTWSVNTGSMAQVCVQAWSYQDKKWHNIGCGQSGGGSIPWGAVVATPKIRAASNGLGTGLTWSY